MRRLVASALCIALAWLPVAAPGSAAATPAAQDTWAAARGDGANTRANLGEHTITPANAPRLARAWQVGSGANAAAPAIVDGVVYHVVNYAYPDNKMHFVARSARTGQTLWTTLLPSTDGNYYRGISIASGVALLPHDGQYQLAGVTAVDLSTHRVLWSRTHPPSTLPGNEDGTAGPLVADSTRAYLLAGNNVLTAFDLRTGAVVWHINPSDAAINDLAVANGVLYTTGFRSAPASLVAYDASTGRRLWTSAGFTDTPVVAGGLVIAPWGAGIGAVPAAGCGHVTCTPLWTKRYAGDGGYAALGGADGSTVFACLTSTANTSRLLRIDARTGTVQWSVGFPFNGTDAPIRAGSMVWLRTEADAFRGWSVSATTSTPLRSIRLPSNSEGALGGLAESDGTLVVDVWPRTLTAYRVPGT